MKKIKRSAITAILTATALSGASLGARAATIDLTSDITNPSFETAQPDDGGPVPGWSGSGYVESGGFASPLPAPADGLNYVTLGANNAHTLLTQTTTAPLVTSAGEVLTLSVADGSRSGYVFNPNVLLEFVLGSNTYDQSSSAVTFTAPTDPGTKQFALASIQYTTTTADIGSAIEIGIGVTGPAPTTTTDRIQLDNVTLTESTVPEPAVTPLLGIGALLALTAGVLRRQKSS